jgi:hypothetical protein
MRTKRAADPDLGRDSSSRRRYITGAARQAIKDGLIEIYRRNHETYGSTEVRDGYYEGLEVPLFPAGFSSYRLVKTLADELREADEIPEEWFSDESRHARRVRTFASIRESIEDARDCHRRDHLADQGVFVQTWIEKRGLLDKFEDITSPYPISLYPAAGNASRSVLHQAAAEILEAHRQNRHIVVLAITDFDPSGLRISRQIGTEPVPGFATDTERVDRLRYHVRKIATEVGIPEPAFAIRRVGLTLEQVRRHRLPENPTKTEDDGNAHAVGWPSDWPSVEMNAGVPLLRKALQQAIGRVVNKRALARSRDREEDERETLARLVGEGEQ